jgi:hypothetical protein
MDLYGVVDALTASVTTKLVPRGTEVPAAVEATVISSAAARVVVVPRNMVIVERAITAPARRPRPTAPRGFTTRMELHSYN